MTEVNNSSRARTDSFEYGIDYQQDMANKYRNRNNNHWKYRIELAHNLIEQYALARHAGKSKEDIVVVDVGCSIGTFAIEYAKLGYKSYGIDFDVSALDLAKQLSIEEKVTPELVCGDISEWNIKFPPIDIAICFDIFEHLHDDELGAFLSSLRKQLSDKGALVFHTFPTEYSYIFYGRRCVTYPLYPLSNVSQATFDKVVKAYSRLLDVFLMCQTGKTYREKIKDEAHCNPVSYVRLKEILGRAGFEIVFMETSNLYNIAPSVQKHFRKQSITFSNLYGVAVPKLKQ